MIATLAEFAVVLSTLLLAHFNPSFLHQLYSTLSETLPFPLILVPVAFVTGYYITRILGPSPPSADLSVAAPTVAVPDSSAPSQILRSRSLSLCTDVVPDMTPFWLLIEAQRNARQSRSLLECQRLWNNAETRSELNDNEVVALIDKGIVPEYNLERDLRDELRAVHVRRLRVSSRLDSSSPQSLKGLPYAHYDYSRVTGACCENVLGYVPLPLGYAGPLRVNGVQRFLPLATTEGCLVASVSRACKALNACVDGVSAFVYADGMTRAPVIEMRSVREAVHLKEWLETVENFRRLKQRFDATSNHARLQRLDVALAGRYVYVRFVATTGDAMGMNMVSKGTEAALGLLRMHFGDSLSILSLSGNYCSDKKLAAVNMIRGRGKSVVAEAVVPASAVASILKTSVDALAKLNISKNLVGSALAGAVGGSNAHASNIITAFYIATGQDVAQAVTSATCVTQMERTPEGDLALSVTLPSLELGTVGGGTVLAPQRACLDMLGCTSANGLAECVSAAVLAGELGLMAALTTGHLVRSHLRLNRSETSLTALGKQSEDVVPPCSSGGALGSSCSLTMHVGDHKVTCKPL